MPPCRKITAATNTTPPGISSGFSAALPQRSTGSSSFPRPEGTSSNYRLTPRTEVSSRQGTRSMFSKKIASWGCMRAPRPSSISDPRPILEAMVLSCAPSYLAESNRLDKNRDVQIRANLCACSSPKTILLLPAL